MIYFQLETEDNYGLIESDLSLNNSYLKFPLILLGEEGCGSKRIICLIIILPK
jgi:hypothetical protein